MKRLALGTYHVTLAGAKDGVERFVLIRTDQAADPTHVIGTTKRAAEMTRETVRGTAGRRRHHGAHPVRALRVARLNGIVEPNRVSGWLSRMFAEHPATDMRDALRDLVPAFRREHAS